MRKAWIVRTGTALLATGLILGALALTSAIPTVQAMDFMNPLSRMYDSGHGHMHGDSDHLRMHSKCLVERQTGRPVEWSDCPYESGMSGTAHHGMHGSAGHMDHHGGNHTECPMIDQER